MPGDKTNTSTSREKGKERESNSVSSLSNGGNSKEYEYSRNKFFEYAYPEHRFNREALNISAYQYLYDAKYTGELINILINQMKRKLECKQIPEKTKIIITNLIDSDENISRFFNHLPSDLLQNNKIKKYILLSPLGIKHHAYALAVHIDIAETIKISVIFRDPYGKRNLYEEKSNRLYKLLYEKFRTRFTSYFNPREISLHFRNITDDLQGFDYDDGNCAVLSLFALERYLTCALLDKPPEEYHINFTFDSLPNPILNESLHEAFILRLKVLHLTSIQDEYEHRFYRFFGFQSEQENTNVSIWKVCIWKGYKAIGVLKALQHKIFQAAIEKYKPFISQKNLIRLRQLNRSNPSESIKLLNSIAEKIVEDKILNDIKPLDFPRFLKSIINDFFNPIQPMTKKKVISPRETTPKIFNLLALLNFFLSVPDKSSISIEEQLKESAQASNYQEFKQLLDQARETHNDFVNCITRVLRALLSNYCVGDQNTTVVNVETQNPIHIQKQIINDLLSEGADIYAQEILRSSFIARNNSFKTVGIPSCVEIISRLPPSYSQPFIEHYPSCVNSLFLKAAKHYNVELMRYLLIRSKPYNKTVEQAYKELGSSLRKVIPKPLPSPCWPIRDPAFIQEVRVFAYIQKIRAARKKQEEQQDRQQEEKQELVIEKDLKLYCQINDCKFNPFSLPQNPHLQLIWFVKKNDYRSVENLLKSGGRAIKNINFQDENGINALAWAMWLKHVDIAKFLIEENAKLGIKLSYSGWSPLCFALRSNDIKFLNNVLGVQGNVLSAINNDFEGLLLFSANLKLKSSFKWLLSLRNSLIRTRTIKDYIKMLPRIRDNGCLKILLNMPKLQRYKGFAEWNASHIQASGFYKRKRAIVEKQDEKENVPNKRIKLNL